MRPADGLYGGLSRGMQRGESEAALESAKAMAELHVHSRAQAVRLALERGLAR